MSVSKKAFTFFVFGKTRGKEASHRNFFLLGCRSVMAASHRNFTAINFII